ncbi:ABC transporter substrate-binding protein [Halobellus sp. GM3]|uniref:ABC transporter substrate-binding protein n=1 Tax=Halobellus sp. GM3 TaxID=3458410 RepID=UPI00403D9552
MDRRSFIKITGGVGVSATTGMAGCLGGGSGNETDSEPQTQSGGGGDETETPSQTESGESELMSSQIALAHYPAITNFTPMVAARNNGFWEDHGMEVSEFVSFSGGGDTVRGLTTGGIGIGGAALSALVNAHLAGASLKIIGIYLSSTDIEFHTRPDAPFESIQDLKGEKIGASSPGSSGEAVLIRSLQEADGISLDDVEIAYTGGLGETATQLQEGAVAAGWTLQPISTRSLDEGTTKLVFRGRDHVDHYTQFTLAASDQILNENRELAEAYVRGVIDGNDFTKENPEEAAAMWAEVADVPEQLAIDSLEAVNPDQMFNTPPTKEILTSTAEAMIEQGTIDEQPNWSEIVDQSVLPESKQVDGF